MPASRVPVSQVTGLRPATITPTSVSLAWIAPVRGTPPIRYSVFYRKKGSPTWIVGVITRDTKATVGSLLPGTQYEFEIFCYNL